MNMANQRPQPNEYPPYYESYIQLAEYDSILEGLAESHTFTLTALALIPAEKSGFRYAEGKWSVAELLQHIADTERIMSYRALRFSRNDQTELPGFDHDQYIREIDSGRLTIEELALELTAVRQSTISLFKNMDEVSLGRTGIANNFQVSVRALGYIIVGHEHHHLRILHENYKV